MLNFYTRFAYGVSRYIYISGGEDDKQCTHFDHEYIITSFTVNNKKIYLLTNQRYIVALSYKNYHPFVLKCLVVSDMKIVEIMATLVYCFIKKITINNCQQNLDKINCNSIIWWNFFVQGIKTSSWTIKVKTIEKPSYLKSLYEEENQMT